MSAVDTTVPDPSMSLCLAGSASNAKISDAGAGMTRSTVSMSGVLVMWVTLVQNYGCAVAVATVVIPIFDHTALNVLAPARQCRAGTRMVRTIAGGLR